eukprot:jgi/Mesvir1/9697/Mv12175-RA.1
MGALWRCSLVVLYGACLIASVTASQVFLTSFLLQDPHVLQSKAAPYFRCLGGNQFDTHYPTGVVASGVRYNYTGVEPFQPMMDMPFDTCRRCGFFITDFVFGGESSLGTFQMCRTNFSTAAPVTFPKENSFVASFTCPTCASAIAPPPPSPRPPSPPPSPAPSPAPRGAPAQGSASTPTQAPRPSPASGSASSAGGFPPPGHNPTAGVIPQSPPATPVIKPANERPDKGGGGGGAHAAKVLLWVLAGVGLAYVGWNHGRNWIDRIRERRRLNKMENFGHLFVALEPEKHESEREMSREMTRA